jgi:hypothetical protein
VTVEPTLAVKPHRPILPAEPVHTVRTEYERPPKKTSPTMPQYLRNRSRDQDLSLMDVM